MYHHSHKNGKAARVSKLSFCSIIWDWWHNLNFLIACLVSPLLEGNLIYRDTNLTNSAQDSLIILTAVDFPNVLANVLATDRKEVPVYSLHIAIATSFSKGIAR